MSSDPSALRQAIESPYYWPTAAECGIENAQDAYTVDRCGEVREAEMVQLRQMFFEGRAEIECLRHQVQQLSEALDELRKSK
jgi:diphthamide synthase (EF-2-diphthine--ammonia ligase)